MDLTMLLTGKYSISQFEKEYKLPYTDWRLPENRIEAFTRVFDTRMREGELDHWLAGKVIADYMELTNEQKAWYCLLFGFSYRNHWAMIVLQLFPDIWNTPKSVLEKWYNDGPENDNYGAWRRANFSNDTKWNVRKFPDFIESVQKWLNGDNLYERISSLVSKQDKTQNFDKLNDELRTHLYGIGRMTSWLAIQTFYEFFDYDIDKWDFQLGDSACWSQFDSLCYLSNKLDYAGSQKMPDGKVKKNKRTKETIKEMETFAQNLMEYMSDRLNYHVDVYNVESCLCEYRKTAYGPRIKEFTFWTVNELVDQFKDLFSLWESHKPEIDWKPYVLAQKMKGPNASNFGYSKEYFRIVSETGLNFNTHYYYADEPNAYKLLDIQSPNECEQPKDFYRIYNNIDKNLIVKFKTKFNPLLHLRKK